MSRLPGPSDVACTAQILRRTVQIGPAYSRMSDLEREAVGIVCHQLARLVQYGQPDDWHLMGESVQEVRDNLTGRDQIDGVGDA